MFLRGGTQSHASSRAGPSASRSTPRVWRRRARFTMLDMPHDPSEPRRSPAPREDERPMREIKVTWQLGLFIAAVFGLPIALAPVSTSMGSERPVPQSVLQISWTIAALFIVAMFIAVVGRLHEARDEQRPDGQAMTTWIVRQVVIGLILCALGAAILAGLALLGVPRRLAAIGCAVAAVPGVLLIGRALSPAR